VRSSSSSGFDLWEAVDGLRDAFMNRDGDRPAPMRMARGDIRTAILVALLDEPMHGYQIIQAIEARSRGAWKPSPGSIYPTLQLLADEGLVTAEQVGERKVYALTPSGTDAANTAADGALPWEPRNLRDDAERNLAIPKAGAKLAQAAAQVARHGSAEQSERTVEVLDEARRRIYAILAED
jgi:DNA-binding PadR family transcriptional regulator